MDAVAARRARRLARGVSIRTPRRVARDMALAFRAFAPAMLARDRSRRRASRRVAPVRAGPFDWLQNNKDVAGRDTMFDEQQEILRKRRSGANLGKEVAARRAKVSRYVNKKLPEAEMKAIEAKNRAKANALSKEAVKGGIPLPMASFGMPEFDGGERFDLRGKYVDEGWVDTESSGPFGGLFGGKKKSPPGKAGKAPPAQKKKGWFGN